MKNKFSDFCDFLSYDRFCAIDFSSVFTEQKWKKKNVVSKDAQCSETDFWVWDMVDFVFQQWLINNELGTCENDVTAQVA